MFTLEEIPESRIAYLRKTGPYGVANIIQIEKIKSWAAANNLLRPDSAVLGIALDDPVRTPPGDRRYDTCLVVPEDVELSHPGVRETHLAGGPMRFWSPRTPLRDSWTPGPAYSKGSPPRAALPSTPPVPSSNATGHACSPNTSARSASPSFDSGPHSPRVEHPGPA
ncbi:GyrI-like domain-containing protein [Streptomyces sp. NPDC055107]